MNVKKKDNLQDSFRRLEKLTEELQSDKIDIEDSLQKFEEGLAIASHIKKRLSEIENNMQKIKVKFSGEGDRDA